MRRLATHTAFLVATFLVQGAPGSAQAAPALTDRATEVPFVSGPRGHLLVDVALNGREPVRFALDTGAGRTVVNEARLADLGLMRRFSTDTVQGAHERSAMGLTDVGALSIGDIALGALELATMDLTHVEGDDMTLFGVLGFDVLSRFDLILDFEDNTVLFHPRAESLDGCAVCQGEISVPFDLVAGTHIRTEVSISDQPIAAILDTGSGRTGMNLLAAAAIGVELPATPPTGHAPALRVGEIGLGGGVLARQVVVGVVDLPVFEAL
nr:clan AA aspartic protease [Gemmatimonadota bacterium]NIR39266.1 clan AA aspartic protease [Actinomycetota bacterium]NIS33974.1 clan AA aspartic protease [Actinomycetota bacterium]NIU68780.1 clan AA aspartic protease [Actinomycetota bacterium]NIW30632.1 hypothetical protein [Actinomycetota bacterium]